LYNALQGLGGEAMKKAKVFEWHKWFKEGCKNVKDDEK
jgi:hypothetical protein